MSALVPQPPRRYDHGAAEGRAEGGAMRAMIGVVVMLASFLLLAKLRVMRSPAAITTVPICATTTPLLRTSGASKAT